MMIYIRGTESQPDPLDDVILDFLIGQKSEMPWLDFKYEIHMHKGSGFPEIAKDIFAMANYGGGYLVAGVKETASGSFDYPGLPKGFHIDQADLQEKFNSYSSHEIVVYYAEPERKIDGSIRKFPVIYVAPSTSILLPRKDGKYEKFGRIKSVFRVGQVFTRRGTQSVPATSKEIKGIVKRIDNQVLGPSILSGEPDSMEEILFGNFLRVKRLPPNIFMGKALPRRKETTRRPRYPGPHVVVDGNFYSFLDLSRFGFKKRVDQSTITRLETDTLLDDESDRDLLVRLLNKEIRTAGHGLGLKYQNRGKQMFFPIRKMGDRYRKKKWPGRYRKSIRTVAKQFIYKGKTLYYHPAVQFRFAFVGDGLYLQIMPSFVLTKDGFELVSDSASGTAITSLSYREYNTRYLLNILFWVSLLPRNSQGMIELNGRIGISDELVQTTIDVGIRGDLPVREQAQELEAHYVDVVKPRRARFQSTYLGEPNLVFGHGGVEKDPRIGMKQYGPYEESDGPPALSQIRIGIVGTGRSVQATRNILDLLASEIQSPKPNKWLFPPFPGFCRDNPIDCEIILAQNWITRIPKSRIDQVLKVADVNERIAKAAGLFAEYASKILMEDTPPAVLIYALPEEIEEYCGISRRTRGAKRPKVSEEEKRKQKMIADGQTFLTEWGFDVEGDVEKTPRSYDLWAALKGGAMSLGVPIQILQESTCRAVLTYSKSTSDIEPPSSLAWNLSTALYYKASGKPWRLAKLAQGTCYVGVSFYRSRHETDRKLRTAMAQVFTHSGEGFVLRGGEARIQEKTREAHLEKEQASQLISEVIERFTDRTEAPPSRIVIHKSSFFSEEEIEGFSEAIGDIPVDYVAIRQWSRFRFLRSGKYPVLRGTLISLTPNEHLLFSHGYSPRLRSYPGHRVPDPLLIQHHGDTEMQIVCKEILGLTKLDWNTTSFNKKMPITLAFSKKVGLVLAEFPEDKEVQSHYKFYM